MIIKLKYILKKDAVLVETTSNSNTHCVNSNVSQNYIVCIKHYLQTCTKNVISLRFIYLAVEPNVFSSFTHDIHPRDRDYAGPLVLLDERWTSESDDDVRK